MKYTIRWKTKALKQSRKIPVEIFRKIELAVDELEDSETWRNVIVLKNHKYDYRMRVGNYRILFTTDERGRISILNIEEVRKRDERTY